VANEDKAASRLKRGGAVEMLPVDFKTAEAELGGGGAVAAGAAASRSPEEAFDARWTRSLFALAVEALRRECEAQGKGAHFRLFARYDLEEGGPTRPTYEDLAAEQGISASLVTNHLAWAHREFRRLLLETLRSLTGSDEEFRLEARLLLGFDPGEHQREPPGDRGESAP